MRHYTERLRILSSFVTVGVSQLIDENRCDIIRVTKDLVTNARKELRDTWLKGGRDGLLKAVTELASTLHDSSVKQNAAATSALAESERLARDILDALKTGRDDDEIEQTLLRLTGLAVGAAESIIDYMRPQIIPVASHMALWESLCYFRLLLSRKKGDKTPPSMSRIVHDGIASLAHQVSLLYRTPVFTLPSELGNLHRYSVTFTVAWILNHLSTGLEPLLQVNVDKILVTAFVDISEIVLLVESSGEDDVVLISQYCTKTHCLWGLRNVASDIHHFCTSNETNIVSLRHSREVMYNLSLYNLSLLRDSCRNTIPRVRHVMKEMMDLVHSTSSTAANTYYASARKDDGDTASAAFLRLALNTNGSCFAVSPTEKKVVIGLAALEQGMSFLRNVSAWNRGPCAELLPIFLMLKRFIRERRKFSSELLVTETFYTLCSLTDEPLQHQWEELEKRRESVARGLEYVACKEKILDLGIVKDTLQLLRTRLGLAEMEPSKTDKPRMRFDATVSFDKKSTDRSKIYAAPDVMRLQATKEEASSVLVKWANFEFFSVAVRFLGNMVCSDYIRKHVNGGERVHSSAVSHFLAVDGVEALLVLIERLRLDIEYYDGLSKKNAEKKHPCVDEDICQCCYRNGTASSLARSIAVMRRDVVWIFSSLCSAKEESLVEDVLSRHHHQLSSFSVPVMLMESLTKEPYVAQEAAWAILQCCNHNGSLEFLFSVGIVPMLCNFIHATIARLLAYGLVLSVSNVCCASETIEAIRQRSRRKYDKLMWRFGPILEAFAIFARLVSRSTPQLLEFSRRVLTNPMDPMAFASVGDSNMWKHVILQTRQTLAATLFYIHIHANEERFPAHGKAAVAALVDTFSDLYAPTNVFEVD